MGLRRQSRTPRRARFKTCLKKLAFHPLIFRWTRSPWLRTSMRFAYFFLSRARGETKIIRSGDHEALFYARTPRELRLLEIPFEEGPGNEEIVLLELLGALRPGDVAYDIGANIGVHSIFMARQVGPRGRVVSVEPDTFCFASLIAGKLNFNLPT